MSRTKLIALLAVSLLFVALGLWIAVVDDVRLGLGCALMFGGGVAIFGKQLIDANRELASAQLDGAVGIPGSIPIAENPGRARMAIVVVVLAGIGSILVGIDRQPLLIPLGALMIGAGVVVVILKQLGYMVLSLMFTPSGIHIIGKRQRYVIPFDLITRIEAADWNGQLILLVWPHSLEQIAATVEPIERQESLLQAMQKSIAWMGAPILIWPQRFGLEGGLLLRALQRYILEPGTRAELGPQPKLES